MAEFVKKEKYEGIWNGRKVRFSREWRGYRFSDSECEALCRGEEIPVRGLVSRKTGNTYGVSARLNDLESSTGSQYVGVEQVDFLKRGVPAEYCGHKFTEDERVMLESGHDVKIDDFVSKKTGKKFGCKVHYDEDQDKLIFDFNK